MDEIIFSDLYDGVETNRIVHRSKSSMPAMQAHPQYEIYYMISGARYYFIENRTYLLSEGCLVLVDSMQVHRTIASGENPHERFLVTFAGGSFADSLSASCGETMRLFFGEFAGVWKLDEAGRRQAESLINDISAEFKAQRRLFRRFAWLKIAELLLLLKRLKSEGRAHICASQSEESKNTLVGRVIEYILENYDKVRSLGEICAQFGVSKSYLCRKFKADTGFAVQEYINMRRVKQAQILLAGGDLPVTQIAASLGYGTLTHFERVFKSYTKTTPSQYRARMRANTTN